jgi:hypothetical protein
MSGGFAAEDGVALHFRGTALDRVVSSTPGAAAYRVQRGRDGRVRETRLVAEPLRAPTGAVGPGGEDPSERGPAAARAAIASASRRGGTRVGFAA